MVRGSDLDTLHTQQRPFTHTSYVLLSEKVSMIALIISIPTLAYVAVCLFCYCIYGSSVLGVLLVVQ